MQKIQLDSVATFEGLPHLEQEVAWAHSRHGTMNDPQMVVTWVVDAAVVALLLVLTSG